MKLEMAVLAGYFALVTWADSIISTKVTHLANGETMEVFCPDHTPNILVLARSAQVTCR